MVNFTVLLTNNYGVYCDLINLTYLGHDLNKFYWGYLPRKLWETEVRGDLELFLTHFNIGNPRSFQGVSREFPGRLQRNCLFSCRNKPSAFLFFLARFSKCQLIRTPGDASCSFKLQSCTNLQHMMECFILFEYKTNGFTASNMNALRQ